MYEDVHLVQQTLSGNNECFHYLIRKYHQSVYAQILSMVNNPLDAEELANDVFIKAYLNLAKLKRAKSFCSWLHQIARHHAQNWLRKQQNSQVSIEEIATQVSSCDSIEDSLIQQEKVEKVYQAINELPETDRNLMRDFYLLDLPYNVLQRQYNLSKNAINLRLIRARQRVRRQIKELLTGIPIFHWRHAAKNALVSSGGIGAMTLSIKMKLVAIGLIVFLVLGGSGILIWHFAGRSSSEQQYESRKNANIVRKTDILSSKNASSSVVSEASGKYAKDTNFKPQKDLEKTISFLDALGDTQKSAEKKYEEKLHEELSPELKQKAKQYAELAKILPEVLKVQEKVAQLCEENRAYSEREYKLRGTPGEIPKNESNTFFAKSDSEIRAGIAEEEAYYVQIDNMFPEFELYEVYYVEAEYPEDRRQFRFHGERLLEYFGKLLPWDGNANYIEAKPWDGIPYWRAGQRPS